MNGIKTAYIGETNREILDATDPRSTTYSMGYIYDTFTWDHCDNDFTGIFEAVGSGAVQKVSTQKTLWPTGY